MAAEYLRQLRHVDETAESTAALDHDGFKPYRDAARWWTAKSQHAPANVASEPAYPPERLWAGVANCSGQMALLPLAAVFPGKPVAAYEATYAIDFLDSDRAVDFCAAINSGIAEVLSDRHNDSDPNTRKQTLIQTDPYHYTDIPFTDRPFAQWLGRGRQWAESADRDPRQLFEKLEQDGKPHYWWDAHFTFVVPLAIMHLCRDDPCRIGRRRQHELHAACNASRPSSSRTNIDSEAIASLETKRQWIDIAREWIRHTP
ncbi:hypothetical protein NZK35_12170 [Stieleria sp. ICT_E10.1]|uniref:hypothetical protein n=1 Tax=Stieleria sedimenti TaxID=2976331 RepID=UPI0021801073|nr:hypothetical protein [Stieleria sedimenti]MCS7467401.1 hypothetical protein [Stieleria sedimenti]